MTLERLRSSHEDIENYERAVVNVLNQKTRNHRERVIQGHRVNNLINCVVTSSHEAIGLYQDTDGLLKEELASMTGPSMFTSFYDRLKDIRTYHRNYPHRAVSDTPNMADAMDPELNFTGEERFGKYLDLHEFYARFLNIPLFATVARPLATRSTKAGSSSAPLSKLETHTIDYISYLGCFYDFSSLSQETKVASGELYYRYLVELCAYLTAFYRKTQPLVDLDEVGVEMSQTFDVEWAEQTIPGWDTTAAHVTAPPPDTTSPLYCYPCAKQFASEGVFTGHLSGKKHKKAARESSAVSNNGDLMAMPSPPVPSSSVTTVQCRRTTQPEPRAMAFAEIQIRKMVEMLTEVLDATKAFIETKQTRTQEELQAEIDDDEMGTLADIDLDDDDDDDEESPFYNPLNLPLGWDGKPIPYWLYKLHGLGVEFKCEICGNHSYWGRRNFDRHFQEWRHGHGMRCLKVPNTKHFHDITLIEDAINLYEKIKDQLEADSFHPGDDEEFEDSEGNVLNKRTYDDLARQGLL